MWLRDRSSSLPRSLVSRYAFGPVKHRAFTLVELLVAVAIIAIFVALTGAALSAARGRADAARCTSNLRQLVAANLTYVAEKGGMFCPAQERSNRVRWHGERISILA